MRGYQAFPQLKEAIADNYKQGKFEGHPYAPQAADFAFIERVKEAKTDGGACAPAKTSTTGGSRS